MLEKFKGIKGAIFDIDGTVLDSMGIWDQAGIRFLARHGVEGEKDLGKILFTKTISEAATYLNETYHLGMTLQSIIDGINGEVVAFYKDEAMAKPGMAELVKKMKIAGIKMTVATSTDRKIFTPALERLDLLKYFDEVYTCSEIGHSKNEPDIFYKAMEFMDTKPEETWLFEDGLYSAKTGKKIGLKVVGVYDEVSLHDWEELKEISDEIITF